MHYSTSSTMTHQQRMMAASDGELETVILINERFGCKFTFIVERIGGNGEKFMLAKVSNPFKKLHITKDCLIDFVSGPPCKDNIFILRNDVRGSDEAGKLFVLQTTTPTNANKKIATRSSFEASKEVAYIGTDSFGSLRVGFESPTVSGSLISFHYFVASSSASVIADLNSIPCDIPNFISTFHCHRWQYRRFVLEGYLHLPALIEKDRLDLCRKKLHRALGTPGNVVPGGVQGGETGKFIGGLSQCGEVTQLLEGRLAAAVAAFLGSGGYDKSNLGAQIAFRFPEKESDSDSLLYDGPKWHTDGLRQGKAHPFSLLVGVCLSDVPSSDSGNLLLWPGSHFVMHRCKVDEHGALDLSLLHRLLLHPVFADCCSPTASAEAPHVGKDDRRRLSEVKHDNEPDVLPSLGKPVQLIASAGDCVFLHPDLAHAGGINLSADVREMIYFRLKMSVASPTTDSSGLDVEGVSSGWDDVVRQHGCDMWADLPGLKMTLSEGDELTKIMKLYYTDL